jgi:NodT family efflux transporter outer membrane factor (OMF) lipoprotein
MVGPNYHRPAAPTPTTYKEVAGWTPATPSDAADRLDWWTAFDDPILNDLENRVAEQRAALYPTISLSSGAGASGIIGQPTAQSYNLGLGATWAPDFFGRVRRAVESAKATAESEADDLANAQLAAQTEVALDYVQLRQLDEDKRILDATVTAYQRTLSITQNKYKVGVAAQSDVLTALAQLRSTQASDADLAQQRPRLEHAIAILVGAPPAELTLPAAPWTLTIPAIPPGMPSTLLQRRPDIAASERTAASASALIGVQVAAYYPSVTLTGSSGFASNELGPLLSASNAVWSAAGSGAETLFEGGARHAAVVAARAYYDEQVANYRQTVLTAFGQVEDNLAAQRVLVARRGTPPTRPRSSRETSSTPERSTIRPSWSLRRRRWRTGPPNFKSRLRG